MKSILFFVIIFCMQDTFAQVKLTNLDKGGLSKSINFKGKIEQAAKYEDKLGEHLIITTRDNKKESKDEPDLKSIDLYVYSYIFKNGQWISYWEMHDLVGECEFDIYGDFMKNSFAVTDLDNNGKAEVWLTYYLACRSDVSPGTMKIIMHEGEKKYAMRGQTKVKVSATNYYGGNYKFDDAFDSSPKVFKQFAMQLWKKNVLDNFR